VVKNLKAKNGLAYSEKFEKRKKVFVVVDAKTM
jgi:hypothetical protein